MSEPADLHALLEAGEGEAWPIQGQWTYEDYARLPDDGRHYEVIRGILCVTAAPTWAHQFSVVRLAYHLTHFCLERDLGVVAMAPFDIRLPHGLADPVEPDLIFFRKGNEPKPDDKNFQGVPDLVIEVLSPRTRRIDQRVKKKVYQEAGVSEYWLVNPKACTVVIYRLDESGRYVQFDRGGDGDVVTSAVLPGLRLKVSDIFLRRG